MIRLLIAALKITVPAASKVVARRGGRLALNMAAKAVRASKLVLMAASTAIRQLEQEVRLVVARPMAMILLQIFPPVGVR